MLPKNVIFKWVPGKLNLLHHNVCVMCSGIIYNSFSDLMIHNI